MRRDAHRSRLAHRHGPFQRLRMLPSGLAAVLSRAASSQQAAPAVQPTSQETDLFSSGFFLRLGFSFIVGLAAGYALKVAFKIALVVGGLIMILLFSLQYKGIIQVDWAGMESNYDGFLAWLAAYAGGLRDFMASHLSDAASFTAGLLLGLRL